METTRSLLQPTLIVVVITDFLAGAQIRFEEIDTIARPGLFADGGGRTPIRTVI